MSETIKKYQNRTFGMHLKKEIKSIFSIERTTKLGDEHNTKKRKQSTRDLSIKFTLTSLDLRLFSSI